MNKREFEALKRRIIRAYNSGDPNYDSLMDDAVQLCSDEEWENILEVVNDAPEKTVVVAVSARDERRELLASLYADLQGVDRTMVTLEKERDRLRNEIATIVAEVGEPVIRQD